MGAETAHFRPAQPDNPRCIPSIGSESLVGLIFLAENTAFAKEVSCPIYDSKDPTLGK
jgi:hypothetical protein